MRQCVLICPDCGDSIIMSLADDRNTFVHFNSRCGTQLECHVDSRNSTESLRIAKLKEEARTHGRNRQDGT